MTQLATPEATTYPPAELDRRFYAFAVDRVVAWGLYAVAIYVAYRYLIEPGNLGGGIGLVVGAVLVVGVGSSLLLGLAGTSPGKALLGLRVVAAETGAPIGVGRALLRTLILGVAALPTLGIGVASLAWTAVMDRGEQRRGWHDLVSHGVVVDVRPVPEVDEVVEERPRQVVNLTAMRLVPAAPVSATSAPTPRRAAPPAPAAAPTTPPAAPPTSPQTSPPSALPAPRPQSAPPSGPPSGPPAQATAPVPPPQLGPPLVAAPRRPAPPTSPPSAPTPPAVPARTSSPASTAATSPAASAASATGVPTWRVTFDTGEEFVVEGLALVGRRPEARSGESVSHLVPLRSSDMSLSKTHAQFQVTPAGALVVMDRGSTNGSVVIRQGVSKALTAGRPTTLLAGDAVCFGDRKMTVERA
ncbi:RDD family protein [Nocardioides psychrotolerans]|uniref:RDD family protein n=1 Tax=Nocardioides psychrotolerans TaxID=1005945 RepID=UPI00313791F2